MNVAADKWYPEMNSGGLVVGRFRYDESLPDVAASLREDREIKRKIIVLESKAIASSDVSVQPVKPYNEREFRTRFPEAWAAFQGEDVKIAGTPVREMGTLNENQILFLQLNGVHSVEQLAALDDGKCGNLGFGWRTTREKAKEFLSRYVQAAKTEDLRNFVHGEVEKVMAAAGTVVPAAPPADDTAVDALKARIAELEAQVAAQGQPAMEKPDPMAKARAAKAAKRMTADEAARSSPADPAAA